MSKWIKFGAPFFLRREAGGSRAEPAPDYQRRISILSHIVIILLAPTFGGKREEVEEDGAEEGEEEEKEEKDKITEEEN